MKAPIDNFSLQLYPKGSVTQWFGENADIYRRWGLKAHNGHDYVAPHGSPIYAVESGRVVDVKDSPDGFGKHVRIRSKKLTAGLYREWTYGHLSAIHVKLGQIVSAGDHIADMGNTGFVVSGPNPFWKHNPYAGTHLHLGVRYAQESATGWKWPGDTRKFDILDYDNGYKGAVDPYLLLLDTDTATSTVWKNKALTLISLLNTLLKRK